MSAKRTEEGGRVCALAAWTSPRARECKPVQPASVGFAVRHRVLGSAGRFNPLSRLRRQLPPRGSGSARSGVRGVKGPDLLPPAGGRCPRSGQRGAGVSVRSLPPDVNSRSAAQVGSTGLSRLRRQLPPRGSGSARSGQRGASVSGRSPPNVTARSGVQAGSTGLIRTPPKPHAQATSSGRRSG